MSLHSDVYSVREVAWAARVPRREVLRRAELAHLQLVRGEFIAARDAVRLVRALTQPLADPVLDTESSENERPAISLLGARRRRTSVSLLISGTAHVLLLLALVTAASLGLLSATYTDQAVEQPQKLKLVYLITPGPGGGGGGGGLQAPTPPPPARLKSPRPPKISSPVPPRRRIVPPARPEPPQPVRPVETLPPPVPIPTPEPPKPIPPAVNAPIVPLAADQMSQLGLPVVKVTTNTPPSQGSGRGGGVGSGTGTGLGEGQGTGIGPGSGGGTGGGPYRPGSGIEPPRLLREIRPEYTVDARRRAIEGDVVLEIVVQSNGTVGAIRLTRGLEAGLNQKAVEAVRQWRFEPARRQGAPVDVVVEVAVEFKLRNP
jgi:TonB family protein